MWLKNMVREMREGRNPVSVCSLNKLQKESRKKKDSLNLRGSKRIMQVQVKPG